MGNEDSAAIVSEEVECLTMTKILVCCDDLERDILNILTKYYEEQVQPSLTETGYDVQLTTCAQALECLESWPADILLMFVPRKRSSCWETARALRSTPKRGASLPLILMLIAWGPDDSPDNPAYYTDPEYAALYDSYHSTFGDGIEIARWVNDFLARASPK